MIDKQHQNLWQRIITSLHNHGSYMDILGATVLLYVLAVVCLMLSKEPHTLEHYLEEQPMPFLSAR